MSTRYIRIVLFGALLTLIPFSIWAQTGTIQLLDAQDQTPIANATFTYGDQTGLTDETGTLSLTWAADLDLEFSHLTYGQWKLNPIAVKEALASGKISRLAVFAHLQPITVVALRPKTDETETFNLDYQDKLSHDGGALLERITGLSAIRKSGNYGFDPVLRGFKYDQLNLVLDGAQSATAACPNRMDPPSSQMAPNMTERIEVLKGPHALRFGNSFGGTINFVPVSPRFTAQPDVYGRISGNYESNGTILRGEGMVGLSGKRYDVGLFGSWSQGQDYVDGNGNTVQADFLRGSFGAQAAVQLTDRQQLRATINRNLAKDADFPALPMDLREDDTWMANLKHTLTLNNPNLKTWETTVFTTLVDHRMDNLLKPLDPRMVNAETEAITRTYGGRTEGQWHLGKGHLYTGADLRVEEAEGIRTREFLMGPMMGKTVEDNAWQHGRISRSGLFGEYHYPMGQYRFVVAGRLELNQADILDPTAEFTEVYDEVSSTQLNPGFSLGGIRNFSNGFSTGLWLGRAQRSGGLTERFINYFPVGLDPFELIGNPQLAPEVNNQVDLTLAYRHKGAHFQLDLFGSYLQDYITSIIDTTLVPRMPTSPGVRQFTNIDQAVLAGFEFNWHQQLPVGFYHRLSAAYTYGQNLVNDLPLPEIAPLDLQLVIGGSWWKDRIQPEVRLRHVIAQDRIATDFGETETPAFTLLDLQLNYRILPNWRLGVGANNLFDVAYYEHLNRSVRGGDAQPIFAPGRNILVSMSVDFD
jgi:iron complex outermembrane receptor protein